MSDVLYTQLRNDATGAVRADMVLRADGAFVPADPSNIDWIVYQAWLAEGNKPTSAPAPTPAAPAVFVAAGAST